MQKEVSPTSGIRVFKVVLKNLECSETYKFPKISGTRPRVPAKDIGFSGI